MYVQKKYSNLENKLSKIDYEACSMQDLERN